MIDTVILHIPIEKVRLLESNPALFPNWHYHSRNANYEKWVKNPSQKDKENGITGPCLTKIRRFENGKEVDHFMKIEFSVPKLLYRNNINEVQERDFPLVVSTLKQRLADMGVIIAEKDIQDALVYTIHPSKNIMLSAGYTASFAIAEIAKINLHKKFDLSKTVWIMGQNLQIYSTSYSLVFYDKIAEVNQSKKKTIDRDRTPQQKSLLLDIQHKNPSAEILRFEVRICTKQKLNSLLKSLGFAQNPTFKDIFKKDICQKILNFYWQTIIKDQNLFIFELLQEPKKLLREILENSKRTKVKEAIYLVALNILCKDDGGIRDLRKILEKYFSTKSWYAVSKGIKRLNTIRQDNPAVHSWVLQIDEAIDKFEPFMVEIGPEKLSTYKFDM